MTETTSTFDLFSVKKCIGYGTVLAAILLAQTIYHD